MNKVNDEMMMKVISRVCTALITKQAVVLKKGFPKGGVKAKGGALCITKYNKWEI